MSTDELHAARLRKWARGVYDAEAATELLIRTGWAGAGQPWVDGDRIDFDNIVDHIGAYSGGEQRLLRIAASIGGGSPVDLRNDVSGLDRTTLDLVLAAIAHLGGSHQHSSPIFGPDDDLTGFTSESSLYPWPGE